MQKGFLVGRYGVSKAPSKKAWDACRTRKPLQGSGRRRQKQTPRLSNVTDGLGPTCSGGSDAAVMLAAAPDLPADTIAAAPHAAAPSQHSSSHQPCSHAFVAAASDRDPLCDSVSRRTNNKSPFVMSISQAYDAV